MFEVKPIVRSLAVAFGGVAAALTGLGAVNAQQQPSQRLERVEITGSAIWRVQQEGPAPVEIITTKDIERTGATFRVRSTSAALAVPTVAARSLHRATYLTPILEEPSD
jgi:outer membrane receptor for ferrienterochelin and colicin